jgi:hypothetical protein
MSTIVLVPEICQSGDCSYLIFKDNTGAYSINNTSGYGFPNESIAGASAELIVTLADGTSTTLTLTGFPTTDKTLEFKINSSDIGYTSGSKIDDQIITFEYKVTTALSNIIVQNFQIGFYCQVNCCVSSMFVDLDVDCQECLKGLGDRATTAYILLQGLKYSANCFNATAFNKSLTQLNKLCLNSECQSCK